LRRVFAERHRLSGALIERAQQAFGASWTADFDRMLSSLFTDDDSLALAAKGYSSFAFDSMRRQKAFELSREYANKTYAQAASEVYFNEQHMASEYLPGLLLSHFLWPHHYRQIQFFDTAFVEPMSRSHSAEFAEIGIGTARRKRLALGGKAFITTALDAVRADHRFADAARRHLGASGFLLPHSYVGSVHPSPSNDRPTPLAAPFVGC
jgi:hypothetical protein